MNAQTPMLPMRRGVTAATLAQFDLAVDELLRHAREELGRHEHDTKRYDLVRLSAETMVEANRNHAERLRAFIDFLETQKSDRQLTGSTISDGEPS